MKAACFALLVSALIGPLPAQAEGPAPLRILSRSHADLGQLREALRWRIDACHAALKSRGEVVAAVELPPDSLLRSIATAEVEQLFDGGREARFASATQVWPDWDQGCQLRLRRAYEAEVAELCGPHWQGRVLPGLGSADPGREVEVGNRGSEVSGSARGQACLGTPEPAPALDGESGMTALGIRCVWLPADETGLRRCVHAAQPRYPVRKLLQGQGLLVLRTAFAPPPLHSPQPLLAELDEGRSEAVAYESGVALPAQRFERASLERHLRQPLWLPLPSAP
jgi:hypothetical protein